MKAKMKGKSISSKIPVQFMPSLCKDNVYPEATILIIPQTGILKNFAWNFGVTSSKDILANLHSYLPMHNNLQIIFGNYYYFYFNCDEKINERISTRTPTSSSLGKAKHQNNNHNKNHNNNKNNTSNNKKNNNNLITIALPNKKKRQFLK